MITSRAVSNMDAMYIVFAPSGINKRFNCTLYKIIIQFNTRNISINVPSTNSHPNNNFDQDGLMIWRVKRNSDTRVSSRQTYFCFPDEKSELTRSKRAQYVQRTSWHSLYIRCEFKITRFFQGFFFFLPSTKLMTYIIEKYNI